MAFWQDGRNTAYLVPRILVTGQRGLDPEIYLPVFSGSNKTLGPFRVLSSQQVRAAPRALELTLDGEPRSLLLSAGVSERAALAMAGDRKMFTELAPCGGARVFDGDAPE